MFPKLTKRRFLQAAGISIANTILPPWASRLAAQQAEAAKNDRKVILVTFGGGARMSDTFAPEGLPNIPRLADLQKDGHFYRQCMNAGTLSHYNATTSILTGNWQHVDDFGFQQPASPTIFEYFRKQTGAGPMDAWAIATNKSFAHIGSSGLRDFGQPYGANVVLPKQLLLGAIGSIVNKAPAPGAAADRDAILHHLETMLQEGYEGIGWTIFKAGRELDANVRDTLTRALIGYIGGPDNPTSGDELTFFIAREIMREFKPRLLLVNFWDMDVAHWGSYSLYLTAVTRTDRLTGALWDEVQANPAYADKTTMLILPELGRDGDSNAANGFLNHRSGDASCRNVWMLALGGGIQKGITERPIHHIDVTATAAGLLNLNMPGIAGTPLREML